MRVFISGLHSGPNPSPGVGIARSLRIAYPQTTLIGVDYSTRSSGIHCADLDELWLQQPWNKLDLSLYRDQIQQVMEGDSVWISGLDLEVHWLADETLENQRILVPPLSALKHTTKPGITAAQSLPMRVPPHIPAERPSWDLHAFCRTHGWPIWCKGPNYEARRAGDWKEVVEALRDISQVWSTSTPSLQAHVVGYEESIAFCAYKGKLLDCVHMRKRLQTKEGKTWAARISDIDPRLRESLHKLVSDLSWTGGGELEFVRDHRDVLHLIDWNPRFPAWIYGATLAGHNLPARLLEAAGFGKPQSTPCVSQEFSRIVVEIPVKAGCMLPPCPSPGRLVGNLAGKHPSGMPLLAKRLAGEVSRVCLEPPSIPDSILEDLRKQELDKVSTPKRIFLEQTARQQFNRVQEFLDRNEEIRGFVHFAYSMKANPHSALLQLVQENRFLVEVINGFELNYAIARGFPPERIILNGPAQLWPSDSALAVPLCAIFADSLQQLKGLVNRNTQASYVGVRLKPVGRGSRFGIDVGEFECYRELVELLRHSDLPALGVHFHIQSDVIGIGSWWETYESMLCWAQSLQETVGQEIRCLDIGGGWFPEDFLEELLPRLPEAVKKARGLLPGLQRFVVEPGKALAQPCMALATRVLEVRRVPDTEGRLEVVVDGATSELPLAQSYPHRILAFSQQTKRLTVLLDGENRILGRHCMEADILSPGITIPVNLIKNDAVVFCDAGAYDRSMSYEFGKGGA